MQDLDRTFGALDEFATPDVWDEAVARRRRAPGAPRPTHRLVTAAVAFAVFASAGFLAWHAFVPQGRTPGQQTEASGLGLTVITPDGWHRVEFTNPGDGLQISNVALPPPIVPIDAPIHPSPWTALPDDGVALLVYEGTLSGGRTTLPLNQSDFTPYGGAPTMGLASFTGNGRTYLVVTGIGRGASAGAIASLNEVIDSIGWADFSSAFTKTLILDPPMNTETFAPPTGDPVLTAKEALYQFQAVDHAFRLPADSTIWLGTYTGATGAGTFRFHDRLAYGIRWRSCVTSGVEPGNVSATPSVIISCARWLFLDANTGKMLESVGQVQA